jgi:hypothetical protein
MFLLQRKHKSAEKLLCISPVLVVTGDARVATRGNLNGVFLPSAKGKRRILIRNAAITLSIAVNSYNKIGGSKNATLILS